LARSQRGLWVKARRADDAIEVFWKPRYVCERGTVTVFDFNGEVEDKVHASEINWGDEWRTAGEIKLVDEMAVMAGVEHFEEFVFSLMRHAAKLMTCGYGDSPEEVLNWFSDFGERKFVVEDQYLVTGSHGEFTEMKGNRVFVERDEQGRLMARMLVREAEFEIDLNDSDVLASFIIATTPI
jgi:hypothetical protein